MMHKLAFVKQPAGLGDIIFGMKIANRLLERAEEVIWPVVPEFEWLNKVLIRNSRIKYPNKDTDYEHRDVFENMCYRNLTEPMLFPESDALYIPLQDADRGGYDPRSVMYSKYAMMGIRYHDWASYFEYAPNYTNQARLVDEIYEEHFLEDGSPFILVNRHFGSPPNMSVCEHIKIDTDLPVVEMSPREGYTMFDWAWVLERATQIHTAETSLAYLIEKLNCRGLNMYSKHNPPNYQHVRNLFKAPWVWHL